VTQRVCKVLIRNEGEKEKQETRVTQRNDGNSRWGGRKWPGTEAGTALVSEACGMNRREVHPLRGQCLLRKQGERLAAPVGMTRFGLGGRLEWVSGDARVGTAIHICPPATVKPLFGSEDEGVSRYMELILLYRYITTTVPRAGARHRVRMEEGLELAWWR
jgi:hypothetical protein